MSKRQKKLKASVAIFKKKEVEKLFQQRENTKNVKNGQKSSKKIFLR